MKGADGNAAPYRHAGFSGWIAPGHDNPDLRNFLDTLIVRLHEGDRSMEPLKSTKDRKVFLVESVVDGVQLKFHVKHDNLIRNWRKSIKYGFLHSRGDKAWRAGQAALSAGIATPAPVAILKKRMGPFLLQEVLVSEYVSGLSGFLDYYQENFSGMPTYDGILRKRCLIRSLAEQVALLHRNGICHGDLKKNNIFISNNDEFVILDMENAVLRTALSTPERIMDLGCLAYSMVRYTCPADRLRFLMAYCEQANIPPRTMKRLVIEISRWIDRKIDAKIRRDHDWGWARRILVVRNDNIGDVICTTPALEALRKAYPKAHIAVLVARYTRETMEGSPFIDRVYSYQKAKHAGFAGENKWKAWVEQLRLIREIRKERFDLAIGIRSKFTSSLGWLVYASGAPIRVGHAPRPKDRLLSFFFNVFVDDEKGEHHEVERALNVVRRIGVDIDRKNLHLQVTSDDVEKAMTFIRELGLKWGKRLVCLHLTSRPEENRWWSPENYARVAQHLMNRGDVDLVLNWTEKDRTLAEEVNGLVGRELLTFVASSLKGFAAFVRECDLFITLEGGAMHISAAVKTPTLAIFGTTSDVVWAPWGERNVTLRGGDHANSVTAEDVIGAADRMLQSTAVTARNVVDAS